MRGRWDAEQDPIRALRRGDLRPYEEFVRAEALTFMGFFRRLGADAHEAEDLTQEVFLRLYHGAREYVPSERFEAYAFRVARNCWIDRQRRRAARAAGDAAGAAASAPAVLEALADERAAHAAAGASGAAGEAPLEVREQADQILSAVADLPEAQRHVFELGVVQELAYSEIAALLGVPEGTVKSRMFHAVRQVREALSGKRVAGRAEGRAGGRAEERAGAAQELQP